MTAWLPRKLGALRETIADRLVRFRPYIGVVPMEPAPLRFFYGSPQAAAWYDPVQPHTRAELEWMAERIGGRDEHVIDAGAYHGLYTIAMARAVGAGGRVIAVDPSASNGALIEVNLLLNGLRADVEHCAVAAVDGTVRMTDRSCGHIIEHGGTERPARRLTSILAGATVVKLDVEGTEFTILPEQLDAMPSVHTWNVEIHPGSGREPRRLLEAFAERGFRLHWLNRPAARVEPCPVDCAWTDRTSLIATRPD